MKNQMFRDLNITYEKKKQKQKITLVFSFFLFLHANYKIQPYIKIHLNVT